MPHSSAVCSCTVRRRHWAMSLRPSKAPMVMLLLPASSASSTYASRKNQSIGSVVFPQDEVALGVQAGGGSFDDAVGETHDDAASGGIGGSTRKQAENVVRGECGVIRDRGE